MQKNLDSLYGLYIERLNDSSWGGDKSRSSSQFTDPEKSKNSNRRKKKKTNPTQELLTEVFNSSTKI